MASDRIHVKGLAKETGTVTGFDIKCIEPKGERTIEIWGLVVDIVLDNGTMIQVGWNVNNIRRIGNKRPSLSSVFHCNVETTSIPSILDAFGVYKITELVGTINQIDKLIDKCHEASRELNKVQDKIHKAFTKIDPDNIDLD